MIKDAQTGEFATGGDRVTVVNKPSLWVEVKSGARRESVLRNHLIVQENVLDAIMFSLNPPQDFGLSAVSVLLISISRKD